VSRTPVREALIDLAAQGMVRFERNRGVRILQTSAHDLEEIFALRVLLEVPATYRATEQFTPSALNRLRKEFTAQERAVRADDEISFMDHDRRFHELILETSGNRRLAAFVDRLRDLVQTRGVSTAGLSRSLADIYEEHRRILDAIAASDPQGAARAMREHVLQTGELILSQQEGQETSEARVWAEIIRFE
jgi:DNA-binding GntR family transcriptional regulator